jgi:hypothetical protein
MARHPTSKLDLYKKFAADYIATREPKLVEIGPAQYLATAGRGAPGGQEFQARIGALYNVAFTVKMARKFAGRDYAVSKLEGLWWGSRNGAFLHEPPATWNWKLLIRTPDFISRDEVNDAKARLRRKGKPAEVDDVGLELLDEGSAVQALHVGPYEREPETLARMEALADSEGLSVHGRHHEIYLSDPRRVPPARLRTILRLPVRRRARRKS